MIRVSAVLAALLTGCAGTAPSGVEPKGSVKGKQRGAEIIVLSEGKTHYFENRHPHCLAYVLAGDWDFAIQEAALRESAGARFAGVVVRTTDSLPGVDPVSRAVAALEREMAKDWGKPVPSESSFPSRPRR